MGQKPTEEELFSMINEVDENNTGKIEFYEFLKVYEKNQKTHDNDDEEDLSKLYIVDAFVAMGGQRDKKGYIDTEKLINVIRHQFEMTIDIEKLLEDIDEDQNHTIDFEEFKRLLSSNY
jgi:calmodulin